MKQPEVTLPPEIPTPPTDRRKSRMSVSVPAGGASGRRRSKMVPKSSSLLEDKVCYAVRIYNSSCMHGIEAKYCEFAVLGNYLKVA